MISVSDIFGKRLAGLRKERYFSQRDCAKALGVNATRYNRWENGANMPDFENIRHIAEHFNTSVEYLLGRTDARNVENQVVANDLKLSDKSIWVIQQMAGQKLKSSSKRGDNLPDDERMAIDVFNAVAETNGFPFLIRELGFLSDPSIINWPNFKYIDDLNGEGYSARSYYRNLVHERLDNIIEALCEQQRRKEN